MPTIIFLVLVLVGLAAYAAIGATLYDKLASEGENIPMWLLFWPIILLIGLCLLIIYAVLSGLIHLWFFFKESSMDMIDNIRDEVKSLK